jgi:hypothetical protein
MRYDTIRKVAVVVQNTSDLLVAVAALIVIKITMLLFHSDTIRYDTKSSSSSAEHI